MVTLVGPRQCREPRQHRHPRLHAATALSGARECARSAALWALHSLRHFFASWAIEQGFTPKRLQALLGHSSIQMTFDTYGHLFPSLEDDHAKFAAGELKIRAALGGAGDRRGGSDCGQCTNDYAAQCSDAARAALMSAIARASKQMRRRYA